MNIQNSKLTRAFFATIQANMYLVSNCGRGPHDPIFAEHVESEQSDRAAQWKRIVNARAAQRNCWVFINKQQWINFVQKVLLEQKYPSALTFTRLIGIGPPRPSNSITITAGHLAHLLPDKFSATVERFKKLQAKGLDVEPLIGLCEADAQELVSSGNPEKTSAGRGYLDACNRLRAALGLLAKN